MAIESDDLLLAGGALLAIVGVGWLLRRPRPIGQPAPVTGSSTSVAAPKAPPAVSTSLQSTAVKSRFTPGDELVTTGPYPEIGYRFDALTRPNTGALKNGAKAGQADGAAFQYGGHVFERLTREGRKVFIVQHLLVKASKASGSGRQAAFVPQAHYVLAAAQTSVRSNLTHQVVGEVPTGTLLGLLKRTLQVAGQSYYVVDAKDSYFDLRVPAAKAKTVTGTEAKDLVARGEITRYGVVSRLGQQVRAEVLPPYFSFLSGPAVSSPTQAYFRR